MTRLATRATASGDLLKLLYRPVTLWAARRTIVGRIRVQGDPTHGRFLRPEVERLLRQAWQRYDELRRELPGQPTLGSRMNVRLAALTHAMLQVLLQAGVQRQYAIELIADTSWKVYEIWARLGLLVARLRSASDETLVFARTRPDGSVALTFPFEAPGYLARPAAPGGGTQTGFDVIRCPVAEYFRTRGEADLCRAAWCDLDFPLAEMRGCTLRRTTTLVEGADRCDFRVAPADPLRPGPRSAP
jgi:hypothetical protein